MRRALSAALLVWAVAAAGTPAGAPLRAVYFECDAWIDHAGLRRLVPLADGEPVTAEALAESKRRLELTEIFRGVEVEMRAEGDGTAVVFRLQRRSIVASVSVDGNRRLRWRDIQRLVRLRTGQFFDPAALDAARERVAARYRDLGYPDARVGVDVVERAGEVDIALHVDEGDPTMVAEVAVTGQVGAPLDELVAAVAYLARKPRTRAGPREGERKLVRVVREHGYYAAEVESLWQPSAGNDGVLWFRVEAGERSVVEITGNAAKSRDDLLGLMDLSARLVITDGTWRELARRMTRAYQDAGYYRAAVRLRIEEGDPRRIVFTVDEGRRYAVRRVRFEGNRAIAAEALQAQMNTRPARWVPWPRRGAFVPEVFDEDLRRLWFFYREEGFETAEIADAPVAVNDETGAIDVTVVIAEGPRTLVAAVRPPDLAGLGAPPQLKIAPGVPLRPAELDGDQAAILAVLRRGGYGTATVRADVARRVEGDASVADVTWQVERGPQHRVGTVIVQGNIETEDRVVVEALPFRAGDPLDTDALLRGQDSVYQTGLFRSVDVRPLSQDATPDVGVEVVPRPPGGFQWGVGYNTRDGFTGFGEVSYDNVARKARRLTLRGSISVEPDSPVPSQYLTALTYLDPRLGWSHWQYKSELVGQRTTRTIDQYSTEGLSFGNGLSRRLGRRLRVGADLQVERVDTFDVETVAFLDEDEGVSHAVALLPFVVFDGRDDPLAPRRGVFDSVDLHYALPGLSSAQYGKLNLQHSQAFPLHERLAFVYTVRAGLGRAFSGSAVVPIRERYFLGGATTVRGFSENSIGPLDANNQITGGDFAVAVNLEWRVAVVGALSAAVFTDGGGLFLLQCDRACRQQRGVRDNALTVENFRRSMGPGLRYMTPVGPISLDYGFKLDRRSGESIGEVHFSIGATF